MVSPVMGLESVLGVEGTRRKRGGTGEKGHKLSCRAQLICDRSVNLPRHCGAIGIEERSPRSWCNDRRAIGSRSCRVLGAAACVASALLLDVPIPETGSTERLKCHR